MGKVPWRSMLASMLASMLGSSCQGMGEVTMGKIAVGFHVVFHVGVQLSGYGPGAPGGASPVGSKSSSRCVSLDVLEQLSRANLEFPRKCPRGFGARRRRPELPLLGRSLRAVASPSTSSSKCLPVSVPVALAPGGSARSFPGGSKSSSRCVSPARSFPCWVEVLEQVSPAGSTGSARRFWPEVLPTGRLQ